MLDQLTITKEGILESLRRIQEREESGFRLDKTCFPRLSELIQSIRDSVVVGGVAGHGKSQLVQQMTVHGALNQNKVLYCDFENPIEELHKSIVLKLANIACPEPGSGPTINDLMKNPEHIMKSIEPHFPLFQVHFYLLKPTLNTQIIRRLTFSEFLEEIIPELVQISGEDTIVVIDSFDELFKGHTISQRSMTETADSWLESLRSIKEKYEITVILVCEYTKSDQTYKEYAAKWSSSIGHFARLNLFIKKSEKEGHLLSGLEPFLEVRTLEVVRNQYGKGTGSIKLVFDTERLVFREKLEGQKYE